MGSQVNKLQTHVACQKQKQKKMKEKGNKNKPILFSSAVNRLMCYISIKRLTTFGVRANWTQWLGKTIGKSNKSSFEITSLSIYGGVWFIFVCVFFFSFLSFLLFIYLSVTFCVCLFVFGLNFSFRVRYILSEQKDANWTGETGRMSNEIAASLFKSDSAYFSEYCFVCGPLPFNELCEKTLQYAGFDEHHIHSFRG